MVEKLQGFFKTLKKAGPKTVILLIFVPACFLVLAVLLVDSYLKTQYDLIYAEDALKVSNLSGDFNSYLDEIEIFIDTASEGVEYLVKQNADHEQIHQYLKESLENASGNFTDDTDGLYGCINGGYIDGFDWIPYEGYDPAERDWYKTAIASGNKTILIAPYKDARTDDMVVTIARALKNGKDVVALDLNLKEIQELTESLAYKVNDQDIMVVDDNGWVIASSRKDEIGRDFKTDEDPERRAAFDTWIANEGKTFITKINNRRYLISQDSIKFGWTAVSVTDVDTIFNMLRNTAFIGMIVIIAGVLFLIILILSIAKRRIKADDDTESLYAVSSIYTTIHKIDLLDNTFQQILCEDYMVSESIGSRRTDTSIVIQEVMKKVTDKRSVDEVVEFVDLHTINERMKYRDTISVEFLNYENLWFRGRFIAVDRLHDGSLRSILWAVEQIDDEKRYRDRLQYLAETDQLTGINNRGSGEHKIRDLIQQGIGGMFVLFDADKFKSINDTFGHEVGDKVLIAIAECMSKTFRDRDIIMRLGGDEFAVYVPYVYNRTDGEPIVERFICAIEDIKLLEIEERPINISIGVAFYNPCDDFTFDDLYKRADSCTYESKKIPGCSVTYYHG